EGGVGGNAERRKGIVLERKRAAERGLAEQHHGARILVACRDFAERGERDSIDRPLAEIGQRACNQVPLVNGVEKLHRAHNLKPCNRVASLRGWPAPRPPSAVLLP